MSLYGSKHQITIKVTIYKIQNLVLGKLYERDTGIYKVWKIIAKGPTST